MSDSPDEPRAGCGAAQPSGLDATFLRLKGLLDANGAKYTVIEHEPEGRTELVSAMRGHRVAQAAKCMIVMVKIGKKVTRFVLAVVPGDRKVDIPAIQRLKSGTFARFAETSVAERLGMSQAGTILPFAFSGELELIVDPALLDNETIFFNAARLDCSMALRTSDYLAIARPRIEPISQPGELRSPG